MDWDTRSGEQRKQREESDGEIDTRRPENDKLTIALEKH